MQISSPGDQRTFAVIGAAMEVHRMLGSGFLEVFYRDALCIEFGLRAIPFETEVPCNVSYKGHKLRGHYRIDFVCFGAVVVEVKARSGVGPAEHAQILSYLARPDMSAASYSTSAPHGSSIDGSSSRNRDEHFDSVQSVSSAALVTFLRHLWPCPI